MSSIIEIEDSGDPRIEVFRRIRDRDIAGRDGLIAEGTVVVEQLFASPRFRATALLLLANRLAGLAPLLARVPEGLPVYAAKAAVMDEIAGFAIHRGVLAHGEAIRGAGAVPAADVLAGLAAAGGTVVVAVGIANHDNIGAIFRNAAAFGAGLVLLDETSCHPLYRKAIRVSAGSILHLPFARHGTGAEILARLGALGFRCLALTPRGRIDIDDLARDPGRDRPLALFLGAEGEGLPEALTEGMETVAIAMEPGFDSLNVATAGAIALHRLRRRTTTPGDPRPVPPRPGGARARQG